MSNKTGSIPLDSRYSEAKAKITNDMKGVCMGEFTFTNKEPCPVCVYHLDEQHDNIPCLCNDSDDGMYDKKITVPWTTVKEIYQSMAAVAMRDES